MIKIMLDPGHGQGTTHNRGFIGGNEGDYNLIGCRKLQQYLTSNYVVQVDLTRTTGDPSLADRGAMAKGYDLLYSWHTNACNGSARGAVLFDDTNQSNPDLGRKLVNVVAQTLGIPNRGYQQKKRTDGKNYYGILRDGYAKSNMIIEHAFHDNVQDVAAYKTKMDAMVKAIGDTLADYYKLPRKSSSASGGGSGLLTVAAPDFLNLRDKPDGHILAELKNGTKVSVLERKGSYAKVRLEGWIHTHYTKGV